ncbi:MAG: Multimeric flavodoxin WrbA [Candidatus Methanohalarchaeum thermophilum]|uniref:Multimeric flavodoxin WrbA n=1 Tax=Methanohalarchaeum thermophilum TaxID=1903181 RepID=A0A1Q6DU75_METT1|nr:MAG: Multimeric flavodoxin WrbA [Candidatus Methanohalarchaeum thermophilum]
MTKILVGYHSKTGNTEKMAKQVANGVRETEADCTLKKVKNIDIGDLKEADGLIIGSPTYYGGPSKEVVELFEKSNSIRGELDKMVGAAFASSHHRAGGNETTLLSILKKMLIHGMLVLGDPIETGGHYGAVSVGEPDEQTKKECNKLAKRVVKVTSEMTPT